MLDRKQRTASIEPYMADDASQKIWYTSVNATAICREYLGCLVSESRKELLHLQKPAYYKDILEGKEPNTALTDAPLKRSLPLDFGLEQPKPKKQMSVSTRAIGGDSCVAMIEDAVADHVQSSSGGSDEESSHKDSSSSSKSTSSKSSSSSSSSSSSNSSSSSKSSKKTSQSKQGGQALSRGSHVPTVDQGSQRRGHESLGYYFGKNRCLPHSDGLGNVDGWEMRCFHPDHRGCRLHRKAVTQTTRAKLGRTENETEAMLRRWAVLGNAERNGMKQTKSMGRS